MAQNAKELIRLWPGVCPSLVISSSCRQKMKNSLLWTMHFRYFGWYCLFKWNGKGDRGGKRKADHDYSRWLPFSNWGSGWLHKSENKQGEDEFGVTYYSHTKDF